MPFIIDDKRRLRYLRGIREWHEDYYELLDVMMEAQDRFEVQEELQMPVEYHKVWKICEAQKNRGQSDDHPKESMRQKVRRLQDKCGVSNCRIYTDLKLNPVNVNAWLKHGVADKVSLDTARRTLSYVEGYLSNN